MNSADKWINPWREELLLVISSLPVRRKPALRRSPEADFLFSTDLPACAEAAVCLTFLSRVRRLGWDAHEAAGWIQLRKQGNTLPAGWLPAHPAGEVSCLIALLARHGGTGDSTREIIALIKAREEGPAALEGACRAMHAEWAARLRRHEPLPEINLKEKG